MKMYIKLCLDFRENYIYMKLLKFNTCYTFCFHLSSKFNTSS